MTASIVESIKFTRERGRCEHGNRHYRYEISHASICGCGNPSISHTYWCDHPLCGAGETPWALSSSPPSVKLIQWVHDTQHQAVAVAYLLIPNPWSCHRREVQARIGLCDQWQDRSAGNRGEPGEHRLFTERYFAASGPGVYPAPIVAPTEEDQP